MATLFFPMETRPASRLRVQKGLPLSRHLLQESQQRVRKRRYDKGNIIFLNLCFAKMSVA